jgi:hypothetical protein
VESICKTGLFPFYEWAVSDNAVLGSFIP